MAVDKPLKVKGATIADNPLVSFDGGLDERGDYNAAPNSWSYGRNIMANSSGNATKRLGRKKWLPDSVGINGEVSTVYYDEEIYYFIADDSKVKYCQENDTAWTDCGGSNAITTTAGVMTTFMRVNNLLLCLNGTDPLRYIDLSNMQMTQFTSVVDPVSVLTCVATGISGSGAFNVYYGITYNSNGGGETAVGPIKTQAVSKSRSVWKEDGTEYLTISFNDTPPSGATSRNIYAAVALQGTTPVASDLVMLRANIPLGDTSFVDNGQIPFDISYNVASDVNTTAGVKALRGEMVGTTPILYGDPENPYDVLFGMLTDDGVSFGGEGTQRLPLLKGTNFYPTSVVGFRNNQNVPSLLALFSGTENISKQQTITKKTVNYGNDTITYWEPEELNAGAGVVYSAYGVVNYLNELLFPSSEGIVSIKTEANLQNVLSPGIISEKINATYRTIKNASFNKIVGTAWNNLILWTIPSQGYSYNNQLAVYDLSNKDKPKWYIWDVVADWIGSVSPPNKDSFIYIRNGTSFFKLVETYVAEDEESDGTSTPFPMTMESALIPFNTGRNSYFALNQVVIYVAEWIGSFTLTVQYTTQKGKVKTKSKTFTNGGFARNLLGGWSNPRLYYRTGGSRLMNWSTPIPTTGEENDSLKTTARKRLKLPNPLTNEVKYKVTTNLENSSVDIVNIVPEGVTIGPIGDIV